MHLLGLDPAIELFLIEAKQCLFYPINPFKAGLIFAKQQEMDTQDDLMHFARLWDEAMMATTQMK